MLDPIHPFPARMAPEIAFDFLDELRRGAVVLDPMCGSGVSLRSAVEKQHDAIGFDADPLAVLMSRVWTKNCKHYKLPDFAADIAERAQRRVSLRVPWHDEETEPFIKYWFARKQQDDLARVALTIHGAHKLPSYAREAMQIALSRLIVTKTRGASLAWDVSHSRPHRKKDKNDFEVIDEFVKSCKILTRKLHDNNQSWSCVVKRGDARKLRLPDASVDAIITSPPYMNAIDYMRGHRLSLVWLGYSLDALRIVRSDSIGSEVTRIAQAKRSLTNSENSPDAKTLRLMDQYIFDLGRLGRELKRVAKRRARVCVISANSNLRGYEVRTNQLIQSAFSGAGLKLASETVRQIPGGSRYLPVKTTSALKSRMMEEHIQYFVA